MDDRLLLRLLLDREAAAAAISVSVPTIDRYIRTGQLQVVRLGRAVRIRPEALEAFVAERTID